jgi:hypothetical protein
MSSSIIARRPGMPWLRSMDWKIASVPALRLGGAAVTNALKCAVAEKLTQMGQPPIVLTSSYFLGMEGSHRRFDECYDDYRQRVQKVYGACR